MKCTNRLRTRNLRCANQVPVLSPADARSLPALARVTPEGWPATNVTCAGFTERYEDDCKPIEIAQRLIAALAVDGTT